MLKVLILFCLILNVWTEKDFKLVTLDEGDVKGYKYWNGDFYEFYGIPYASVPQGRDRFKGPLPPKPWKGVLEAKDNSIGCVQQYYTKDQQEELVTVGVEECLVLNLFVPKAANEKNLVPVLVYIHSGAFAIGHGNIGKYTYLVKHDVLVISWNYRLGALGFLCLGTEEVPGNAAMKDQVAALRWINKNIHKFGGDSKKVTVAGFSVGAGMAELLALSKSTEGLIDKIILDSGSALSPWAVSRDPIKSAKNIAYSLGFNERGDIKDLTEFYLSATVDSLALRSLDFHIKNSTFVFAPCVEPILENSDAFLTESPLKILQKGEYKKLSVLTGFAEMEGISRTEYFKEWAEEMKEDFADFLPADLKLNDKKTRERITKEIKAFYFGETFDNLKNFIDYFSDSMFKYSIMSSATLHAGNSARPVYFYEFSYVGKLSAQHDYVDEIRGASHRDQTSYIIDFYKWTGNYSDLDTRDRLTAMWTDFVKFENPTAFESSLISLKWQKFTKEEKKYLSIDHNLTMKNDPFPVKFEFWKRVYENNYWHPTQPTPEKISKVNKKDKKK